MIKSGLITSVNEIKTGVTNGRKWTIFEVDIEGEKFSTFDPSYKTKVGKVGNWEYEIKQKGEYQNKQLKPLPKPKAEDTIKLGFGYIRGDIKRLETTLKRIEEKIDYLMGVGGHDEEDN